MSGGDWNLPYFDLTAHGLRVLKMDDICRVFMGRAKAIEAFRCDVYQKTLVIRLINTAKISINFIVSCVKCTVRARVCK